MSLKIRFDAFTGNAQQRFFVIGTEPKIHSAPFFRGIDRAIHIEPPAR
jgi:hypothetical protein